MMSKSCLCTQHEGTFYFSKFMEEEIAQKYRGRSITGFRSGFGSGVVFVQWFLHPEAISLTHLDMLNPVVGIGSQTKLLDFKVNVQLHQIHLMNNLVNEFCLPNTHK